MIFDTQHVAQLQRVGSRDAARLEVRMQVADVRITVITPYEQLRDALGRINSAPSPEAQVPRFELLRRLINHYATYWSGRILAFDDRAAEVYLSFDQRLIRSIGSRDARIGAIALVHNATVLTANTSNFQKVPGLSVADWLRDGPGHPEPSP
jgi:tRNA(fMet)-specific endonuclease VapC